MLKVKLDNMVKSGSGYVVYIQVFDHGASEKVVKTISFHYTKGADLKQKIRDKIKDFKAEYSEGVSIKESIVTALEELNIEGV